nr:hypothetical protein GCM10017745_30410 [Saccharothrix mutabilis subsp. capreolus]
MRRETDMTDVLSAVDEPQGFLRTKPVKPATNSVAKAHAGAGHVVPQAAPADQVALLRYADAAHVPFVAGGLVRGRRLGARLAGVVSTRRSGPAARRRARR